VSVVPPLSGISITSFRKHRFSYLPGLPLGLFGGFGTGLGRRGPGGSLRSPIAITPFQTRFFMYKPENKLQVTATSPLIS